MNEYTMSENDVWVSAPKIVAILGGPRGVFAHYGRYVWFWFTDSDEYVGAVITDSTTPAILSAYGRKGTWSVLVVAASR